MHLFISGLEIRSGSTRLIVSGISMCLCLSLMSLGKVAKFSVVKMSIRWMRNGTEVCSIFTQLTECPFIKIREVGRMEREEVDRNTGGGSGYESRRVRKKRMQRD